MGFSKGCLRLRGSHTLTYPQHFKYLKTFQLNELLHSKYNGSELLASVYETSLKSTCYFMCVLCMNCIKLNMVGILFACIFHIKPAEHISIKFELLKDFNFIS